MDSIEHQKDSVKKYRIRDDGRIEALRPGPAAIVKSFLPELCRKHRQVLRT